jgi:ribosomal protein S18 acetylase RimI-like enzyme
MQTESSFSVVRIEERSRHLLDGLDRLHREFFQGSPVPPEQFMEFVAARLGDERMLLVVGLAEEQPAGYGLSFDVVEHPFMPEWQRSGYVTQLYVAPERRGQGLGQMLVDHTLEWMRLRGIRRAQLNVLAGEDGAEGYWRRHGFEPRRIRMELQL